MKDHKSVTLRWLARKLIPYIKDEKQFFSVRPKQEGIYVSWNWFRKTDYTDLPAEDLYKVITELSHEVKTLKEVCRDKRDRDDEVKKQLVEKLSEEEISVLDLKYFTRSKEIETGEEK